MDLRKDLKWTGRTGLWFCCLKARGLAAGAEKSLLAPRPQVRVTVRGASTCVADCWPVLSALRVLSHLVLLLGDTNLPFYKKGTQAKRDEVARPKSQSHRERGLSLVCCFPGPWPRAWHSTQPVVAMDLGVPKGTLLHVLLPSHNVPPSLTIMESEILRALDLHTGLPEPRSI